MIKAEIIAANDGVKASELSRQLVLQGVRKEQAEALIEQISGNEAITSNTVLTKEQTTAILEQAEARKMLSAQQRKNIADDIEEAASSAQEASTEIAQASADMAESGTKIGSASSILARGVAQLGAGLKSFLSIFVSNPVAVIATITGSVIGLTYVIGRFQDTAKNAAKSASNFATSMSSANSTYNQEIDSLNELIEKYKDLREQLISAKGDEEKTYNIKSQMLELQKQLNEIYGDECDNVNLVTNAYRDQTEELKKNAKQKADNYLNTHVDEIEEATRKMTTNYEYELGNFNYGLQDASVGNELHDEIKKLAENNGIEWDDNKGFIFKGTAEEASKAINQFMTDVRELRDSEDSLSNGIINNLKVFDKSMSDQLGIVNQIIEGYQETYETAQMAQIASDKDLSEGYNNAISAVEKYNDAISKSENPYDDENVKEAWDNLQTIKNGIQNNEKEWGQYSNILDRIFSTASDDAYSFYQTIQNDNSIKSLTNDLQGLYDTDLQSMADDGIEDSFDKLCESAKEYGLEIQDVIDLLIQLGVIQGKVYDEDILDETPISFVNSMTEVEKSKTGFDLIDKIYADVKNKEEFDWTSILNNTSFTETFGNMENVTEEYKSVYDEFIETVSNSPSDIDKCQKAFNRLTTAYLQNEGTLSAITDQSKEAAILYLQEQGVVNATEVVYASLLKTKLESEEASIAVANGTASEINSLLTEGAVTEETAQKLAAYALHKSLVNTETIDTAADCENVMRLAKVAGASVEALSQLDALKQRLADNPIMSEEMRKTITNKIKSIVSDVESSAVASIEVPEVDYKGGSTTQKAADSAKKTADDLYNDLKEQIDAYMDYMEKSLDAGKIDYNTYCSSVKNYLDNLYNSGKLKAKDYFDYTEKMLNKQKDIYDKVISAVVDRLEEEVDKWQEKIDELESTNDKLNDNLSNMDSALDAIDRVYDNEIDRIQAIIDGLKDANDERDRTLALEKAKYELEKAYSQKIKKLYVEGKGYIYTPDYDAIKDAQSSYDDAELDIKTSELQKQIDTLTDFKSKWDNVKNAYQNNIDEMNASALLGSEYQKLILNNNILDVENFKNQYVGIQQQINSNEELIKSYNEKVNYYNKLKEQWQSITDEYNTQMNAQYASQVLGANWENDVLNGRLSTLDGFRTQYISVQQAIADAQWQSANEQIKALQALANAAWASANEQINAAKEAQKAASGSTGSAGSVGSAYNVSGMISAGAPTSVINKITGKKSNTSAAATADQRKNNSNIIMSNEQKRIIAASKKHVRKYANGGVVKINPDDLLADLAKQHGEDGFVMARNGERVLTPNQNASFEKFVDLITGMNITPQMLMPDFTKFAPGTTTDNSSVIVNIGDINLQGVQNAEQLGDAIIKRLPGYITQKFNNKQR